MKPGRLIVGLVLLLVTATTLGAVVVHGERDRRATAGPDAAATSLSAVARPAPVVGAPHGGNGPATLGPTAAAPTSAPATRSTPHPARTARPTPKPKPTLTPTPEPKPKPKRTAKTTARTKAQSQVRSAPRASGGKVVYLTFDDGPGRSTPQVLKVLRETGSTATFFQLGVNARGQQHLQAAIRAQGSTIGNHTWNHPDLTRLTAAQLRRQIADGPRSRCVRPPYGATNAAVRAAIGRAGAHQVLWTVDSRDWTKPGTRTLERLGSSALVHGGSIVLMHDGGGDRHETVAALPTIIKTWQGRGYVVRALTSCG